MPAEEGRPFDFLVDSEFLRASLAKHLDTRGISKEEVIEVAIEVVIEVGIEEQEIEVEIEVEDRHHVDHTIIDHPLKDQIILMFVLIAVAKVIGIIEDKFIYFVNI